MAEPDGWTLYEELVGRTFDTLRPPEQRLVAFGELRTEVNNGGFGQYFFNGAGDHAQAARDAVEESGLQELVSLIHEAVGVLGRDPVPADRGVRQDRLAELEDDAFEALDERYFAVEASEDLDASLNLLASRAK